MTYIKVINKRGESKLYSHLCPKLLLRWHCLTIAMISFSTDNSEMPFWGWKSRLSLTLTMWDLVWQLFLIPSLSSCYDWWSTLRAGTTSRAAGEVPKMPTPGNPVDILSILDASLKQTSHILLWSWQSLFKLQVLVLCLEFVVLNGCGTHWVSPSPCFDISQLSLLSHFVRFTKSSNFVYCIEEPS